MAERYTAELDGTVVATFVVPRLRVRKHKRLGTWRFECLDCRVMRSTPYGWRFAMGLAHAHLLQRHGAGRSVAVLRGESCG